MIEYKRKSTYLRMIYLVATFKCKSSIVKNKLIWVILGEEHDYGKQRVWGTIGFGLTALIAGYIVNIFSYDYYVSYTPAFAVMLFFSVCDLFSCVKLKVNYKQIKVNIFLHMGFFQLPVMESPENIFKDLKRLMNNRIVITFIMFAILAGIVDSFIIYFLFWYKHVYYLLYVFHAIYIF